MNIQEKFIPKMLIEINPKQGELPPNFDNISLIKGSLFINNQLVETSYKDNNVYWSRKHDNDLEEIGCMKLSHQGFFGKGVVKYGETKCNFIANGYLIYTMSYIINEISTFWYDLKIGFDNNSTPVGYIIYPDGSTLDGAKVLFSEVNNLLNCSITLSSVFATLNDPPGIYTANVSFATDYHSFTGVAYKYNNSLVSYDLSGVYKETGTLNEMISTVDRTNLELLNSKQPKEISLSLRNALELSKEDLKSVNDLFTLPAPDQNNVQQLSFSKLKNLMMYSIDDEWIKWFGETRPTIDGIRLHQSDVDVLNGNSDKVKNFLTNKFGIGYLTQAFSSSPDEKIQDKFKEIPNVKEKLEYFWKGIDDDTCFGKDEGYNIATHGLMKNAYIENVPELSDYISDNPTDWAQKLYNYCITEPILTGLALQTNIAANRNKITHLSTILFALDSTPRITKPNGKIVPYSYSLYEKVLDCTMNNITTNSITTDELNYFLTEYFKQLFNSFLADSDNPWQTSIRNEAQTDLNDLMKEYQVNTINDLVNKIGTIIADAIEVMNQFKELPMAVRINKWALKYPKISRIIGVTLTMGIYGFSIYQSILSLMKWDELKPEEKTQVITNIVDTSTSMFKDFANYKAAQAIASSETKIPDIINSAQLLEDVKSQVSTVEVTEKIIPKIAPELEELSSPVLAHVGEITSAAIQTEEGLAECSSKWIKISNISEGIAEGISLIALGAACVCTGFEIANDFSEGQPTSIKVLDILGEVANGIAFIAAAVALMSAEVLSCVPVIGVVAAVVGIGISIAEMFIHKSPPPTPEETLIDEHSKPFIEQLVMPTQDWINKQQKI